MAGKGQRARAPLLLRNPADPVIERIIDGYAAVQLHRQPMGHIEIGIANLVLRAAAIRQPQFCRPPLSRPLSGRVRNEQADRTAAQLGASIQMASLRLRLEAGRERHEWLLGQQF